MIYKKTCYLNISENDWEILKSIFLAHDLIKSEFIIFKIIYDITININYHLYFHYIRVTKKYYRFNYFRKIFDKGAPLVFSKYVLVEY